jgi:hypothetical protein
MKLCSLQLFLFEIIFSVKFKFESLKSDIQILLTTSSEKTSNMKVLDLKKL